MRIQRLFIHLRRFFSLIVATVLLATALPIEGRADALATIQSKIKQYLKRPGVRSAQWGIQITDPADNKVLVEVNPDKPFLPASVLKVVTTSAAIEKLGPDFRYRTGVYTNGTLDTDGSVSGDIILVGRGDPNLVDTYGELSPKPALLNLAEQLQDLGIKEIQGDIIGDDSYFNSDSPVKGWTAGDLKTLYGAPVNALSINNNVIWVTASPSKYKKPVLINIEPRTSYFRIRNQAVTGGRKARQTLSARLLRGTNTIVISGRLPSSRTSRLPIVLAKPAETTATIFKEELQRHGITIRGKVSTLHDRDTSQEERNDWALLAEHQSLPLIRALEIINKHSQNLHAEMLLRTSGSGVSGEKGPTKPGWRSSRISWWKPASTAKRSG